jgi:hypothetical protein
LRTRGGVRAAAARALARAQGRQLMQRRRRHALGGARFSLRTCQGSARLRSRPRTAARAANGCTYTCARVRASGGECEARACAGFRG